VGTPGEKCNLTREITVYAVYQEEDEHDEERNWKVMNIIRLVTINDTKVTYEAQRSPKVPTCRCRMCHQPTSSIARRNEREECLVPLNQTYLGVGAWLLAETRGHGS
jgi:hypothetical protein